MLDNLFINIGVWVSYTVAAATLDARNSGFWFLIFGGW